MSPPPLSGISGLSFDSLVLSALLLFCPSPVAHSIFSFFLQAFGPVSGLLSRNVFKLVFLLQIGLFVLPLILVVVFSG